MNELTKAWLDSALLDLKNIEMVISEVLLTPVVAFHAQQCIEKTFKAFLQEKGLETPRTHDLVKLYHTVNQKHSFPLDIDLLLKINDLYVDARYPGDLGLLPNGKPDLDNAKKFYTFAKSIYTALRQHLLSKK
jgi:HEPN domain-containing protein